MVYIAIADLRHVKAFGEEPVQYTSQ